MFLPNETTSSPRKEQILEWKHILEILNIYTRIAQGAFCEFYAVYHGFQILKIFGKYLLSEKIND